MINILDTHKAYWRKKKHPWIEDYIINLLKTDLDFANGIENSKGKLELLETEGIGQLLVDVLMKTTESNKIPVDEIDDLIEILKKN